METRRSDTPRFVAYAVSREQGKAIFAFVVELDEDEIVIKLHLPPARCRLFDSFPQFFSFLFGINNGTARQDKTTFVVICFAKFVEVAKDTYYMDGEHACPFYSIFFRGEGFDCALPFFSCGKCCECNVGDDSFAVN